MVNTNKIKGRIKELGLIQADVARSLGMAQSSFNQKINNIRPFDLCEAERLAETLQIAPDQFGVYFFNRKVAFRNSEQED